MKDQRIVWPWGSLSEARIALRHYIARQLGLRIHPGTARRTTAFAAVTVSAFIGLMIKAKGAFDEQWYLLGCGLLKEIPTALAPVFSNN